MNYRDICNKVDVLSQEVHELRRAITKLRGGCAETQFVGIEQDKRTSVQLLWKAYKERQQELTNLEETEVILREDAADVRTMQ